MGEKNQVDNIIVYFHLRRFMQVRTRAMIITHRIRAPVAETKLFATRGSRTRVNRSSMID